MTKQPKFMGCFAGKWNVEANQTCLFQPINGFDSLRSLTACWGCFVAKTKEGTLLAMTSKNSLSIKGRGPG